MIFGDNVNQVRDRFILVGIGLVLLVIVAGIIFQLQYTAWDFRNNLWGPSHLVVTGRDPYAISQLFPGSNSVWMPMIVGVAFWMGYLPEAIATNLWLVANLAAYAVVVVLSLPQSERNDTKKPALLWFGAAFLGAYLLPSYISLLVLGQIGVFISLLMLLAAIHVRQRPMLAALLLVLAAAKPQLLILCGPGLLIAVYREHNWGVVLRFVLTAVVAALLMLIPLCISVPGWLDSFFVALGRNPQWAQPSTLYILSLAIGLQGALVIFALLAVGVFVLVMRMWWRTDNYSQTMIWTLALTTIVTPYIWSWDFVLLVPLFVWVLFDVKTLLARLLIVIGYSACWSLFMYIRIATNNSDHLYGWLPWSMLAIVLLSYAVSRLQSISFAQKQIS